MTVFKESAFVLQQKGTSQGDVQGMHQTLKLRGLEEGCLLEPARAEGNAKDTLGQQSRRPPGHALLVPWLDLGT